MLVRNLSAEFTKQGHASHILFMSDATGVGNPPDFERDFLAGISAAGVSYDVMEPGSFSNFLRATARLRQVAKAFHPDIVHVHLGRGMLCRSLSGLRIPTVYTHHSIASNFPPLFFKLFDRSIAHYVAISGACRDVLERHVRRPITTIPNGVPASFSATGVRTSMSKPRFVLSVGSLRAAKDYATLIKAAEEVIARSAAGVGPVRFAIAGEGTERQKLERLIREQGLTDHFRLLGTRTDVAALMQRADLLVNSSLYEGLPITLIEAAASGLPIVATNAGGNSEVVDDGVSGFIVPPSNPEMLADRILDILSDGQRHAAFSRAARARSERFTITACADSHLRLYQSLLTQAG